MGTIQTQPWDTEANRQLLLRVFAGLDKQATAEKQAHADNPFSWSRIKTCLKKILHNSDVAVHCDCFIEEIDKDNIPFIVFSYQFSILQKLAIRQLLDNGTLQEVQQVLDIFEQIEEDFSRSYLNLFLGKLEQRSAQRLKHIRLLTDKNLLHFFESHLEWLLRLARATHARDLQAMPETNPNLCQFGRWLNGEGRQLIRDDSRFEQISHLHASMHHVVIEAEALFKISYSDSSIYALIKKAEELSLELGNEIALLNSMVIMNIYNKDALTGFLTRHFLDRIFSNQLEITKATETTFSIIMFDLDHFKRINDRHGHQTGDQALKHVAEIVRTTIRQSDLAFRYGGEEFLLMLPSTTLKQAQKLAEKLRQKLVSTPLPHDPPIPLSASFGVTEIAHNQYDVIDKQRIYNIIHECDNKLYNAKNEGRNRVA